MFAVAMLALRDEVRPRPEAERAVSGFGRLPVLANSTRLPPLAASISPLRWSTRAAGALVARFASGLPASTPRQAQFRPWGSFVKYVLKSTSHRLSAGSNANASANKGKISMPGSKIRKAGRCGSARNDSASTPAQPASPVSACQAARCRQAAHLEGGSGRPRGRRGSPRHDGSMNPGWLKSQAGPPAGRSAGSSTTWWAYLFDREV